jgi:hypothetical protein
MDLRRSIYSYEDDFRTSIHSVQYSNTMLLIFILDSKIQIIGCCRRFDRARYYINASLNSHYFWAWQVESCGFGFFKNAHSENLFAIFPLGHL